MKIRYYNQNGQERTACFGEQVPAGCYDSDGKVLTTDMVVGRFEVEPGDYIYCLMTPERWEAEKAAQAASMAEADRAEAEWQAKKDAADAQAAEKAIRLAPLHEALEQLAAANPKLGLRRTFSGWVAKDWVFSKVFPLDMDSLTIAKLEAQVEAQIEANRNLTREQDRHSYDAGSGYGMNTND